MTVPAPALGATRSANAATMRRRLSFIWGLDQAQADPVLRGGTLPLHRNFRNTPFEKLRKLLKVPVQQSARELEPLREPRVLGRGGVETRQRVRPAPVGRVVAADAVVHDAEVREDLSLGALVPETAQDLERSLERPDGGVRVDGRLGEGERAQRQRLAPLVTGLAVDLDGAAMCRGGLRRASRAARLRPRAIELLRLPKPPVEAEL